MEHETNYPDNRWMILGVMSLSLVIVMLNNVTLNVALPELSKDLKADNSQLQWIMDSYALVFGGTLLLMGALGDRFGRKGALQIGLVIVACASVWTALYAETSNQVIFARAAMGLGAALVMPSTLSVVLVVFPPEERGKAIGIWAAMAGIGAPIGLLVGGWAVENYDWQMVFLINAQCNRCSSHFGRHTRASFQGCHWKATRLVGRLSFSRCTRIFTLRNHRRSESWMGSPKCSPRFCYLFHYQYSVCTMAIEV